jgi:histone deacetylase 6
MGEPPGQLDPWRLYASEATVRVVNKVINTQSQYWKCFRPQLITIGTAHLSADIDGSSPAPERLNGGFPQECINKDIIRAYQTKKAQEKWGMTPLPIAKNDMTNFEDQVFCSKDFYDKKTLILFIHDAPDVVIGPNATISSKMDLNETFLVLSRKKLTQLDASNQVFEWANKMDYGLIDVNIPPSSGEHEVCRRIGGLTTRRKKKLVFHKIPLFRTRKLYVCIFGIITSSISSIKLMQINGCGECCFHWCWRGMLWNRTSC